MPVLFAIAQLANQQGD